MTDEPTKQDSDDTVGDGEASPFMPSIISFLGLGIYKGLEPRGKFFPMSVVTHGLLLIAGIFAALWLYQSVSLSLYNDYRTALRQASVVCDFLTDYGSSAHYNCDKENKVLFYEKLKDPTQAPTPTPDPKIVLQSKSVSINGLRLSTKDLASMMVAAGIEDAKDLEEPATLLLLDKSGPGGWIATALLSSITPSSERLDSVMLAGSIDPCPAPAEDDKGNRDSASDRVSFGTIDALNVAFRTLGKKEGGDIKCKEELKKINDVTGIMIDNITGRVPRYFHPFQDGQTQSTSNAIKSAMNVPWDHYMPSVIFYKPGDNSCTGKLPRALSRVTVTGDGAQNYYEVDKDSSVCIQETLWYRYDPTKIYHAMFSFGTFLLNEVFRDDAVKQERFLYQAWRGPIQFFLLVIFFYLLFILAWRFIASLKQVGVEHTRPFHRAMLVQGIINDKDHQAVDSRAYIDLMISTLPLIGLFGTVIGILFGLPNAADAVTAVGPGATDAVNSLFENLGLAFSTTAIAVLSVVILEVVWLILQRFEEHSISYYFEQQNSAKK